MDDSRAPTAPISINHRTADIGKTVSREVAGAFGDAVTVLMHSPFHRAIFLPELEWLIAPGFACGQYAIAHRTDAKTGTQSAVGFVTWATVSDEVSRRLIGANGKPRLKPEEWRSGKTAWLIEAAGEADATRNLISSLVAKQFSNSGLNVMQLGADGKYHATRIEPKADKPTETLVN